MNCNCECRTKIRGYYPLSQFGSEKDDISIGEEIEVSLDSFEDGLVKQNYQEKKHSGQEVGLISESHDEGKLLMALLVDELKVVLLLRLMVSGFSSRFIS